MFDDELCVGSFNILADGLSSGEFLCEGGDAGSTNWTVRCDKIVSIIAEMLDTCDVVVTQENDHFVKILDALNSLHNMPVGGVFGTNVSKPSKAQKLKAAHQLSHYHKNNHSAPVPQPYLSDYEQCNEFFQKGNCPSDQCVSFIEESPMFGEAFAAVYEHQPTDLYRSDDGVGIYYRTDKLHLDSVHIPDKEARVVTTSPSLTIVTNVDYVVACTFRIISTPACVFTLYGAHLRSGEDVSMEHARCRQLHAILNDSLRRPCPIVAMDSNSSTHYEADYPDILIPTSSISDTTSSSTLAATIPGKLSTLIQQCGFVDAVGPAYQRGNECFKMRHGQGGQPSKHYQFMFDAIDKILVPSAMHILPHKLDRSEFGFVRYDPTLRDELTQLRASAERRSELQRECRGSARVNSTTCSVTAFGAHHLLAGLYPNHGAPSDHPPVSCAVRLSQS